MKKAEARRLAQACLGDDAHVNADDPQVTTICRLWGGMGHIYRISCTTPTTTTIGDGEDESHSRQGKKSHNHNHKNAKHRHHNTTSSSNNKKIKSFIVKSIQLPSLSSSSFGDRRKAFSYQVEANFYEKVAPRLLPVPQTKFSGGCGCGWGEIPRPLLVERPKENNLILICMSELCGRSLDSSNLEEVQLVLSWLAHFHAAYWGPDAVEAVVDSAGLQPLGTYWHLDTRPDEHDGMSSKGLSGRLKRAARAIDKRLKEDPHLQCLIHGDAKEANIMIDSNNNNNQGAAKTNKTVSFCDFQYCGKGPPTKDLAYFLCSSLDDAWFDEDQLLQYYHDRLVENLQQKQQKNNNPDAASLPPTLEQLNDSMDLAYCDYYRFMCGWGHWGSSSIEKRVRCVMDRLDGGTMLKSPEDYDEAVQREYSCDYS